ncbi:NADH:ubiquinone reductase (Na(+)-transporting) subunit B [Acidiluteibacter ferrifornacis]|uniref:Na(+)-translocating NADH-quinone reductase subunit B n=1 Tax=Acidiluteibacter ferrifornacis TaxID=2692424 RepID=A0A6N9NJ58_9FLAO|nr:NADH:ubiquinone reductase (Na(+)-transporting) subunit B [Acidiluteibacter ferrifornacis]MBR9833212.1 NADH:ubiquinone reductase (Na(+)-transporting) subunit B [bacterium]NBG66716.1 NADH:ubiquinone reductase (Na(+)-transporting) subunit B [Acidiluteibacter ferrifornacis]
MNIFRKLLDSVKPNFEKGGKLEKFYPAYDAFETFLFVPGHTANTGAHIRDAIDLKRTMITVVIAMIPALLFGIWNTGYQHFLALGQPDTAFMDMIAFGAMKVLPIVIVSYAVGLGVEFVFGIINGHSINEGFLVTGMLIPLCLPVGIPLWMVAVATLFAVVIGKEVFGGTGMNILNVALTARAFLFFAYPTLMSGDKVWIDTTTAAGETLADGYTGATLLAQSTESATNYVNAAGVQFTDVFSAAFMGTIPGSIGETSVLAILIGAAILIYTGIGSWRIMLSGVIGGLVMSLIFNAFAVNPFMEVPAINQLVFGGFAFGIVFMATDPVTAAQTTRGKWIYGFLIGIFAIMIRVFNPAYPEGVMLAILFMNVMAPLIDHYVIRGNVSKRLKRVKVAA